MDKMDNKEIDFIARHYRKNHFSADKGWRRLGIAPAYGWRRYRVAAAISVLVVLTATAGFIFHEYSSTAPEQTEEIRKPTPLQAVKTIDFENAPLTEVVKKIESVYSVKVVNLPESTEGYKLSLHYEGTPADLIATINEILGTQMEVVEK
jgi:hypothetical protein